MNKKLLIVFILSLNFGFAKNDPKIIDSLIDQLSWESITYKSNYYSTNISLEDSAVTSLINHKFLGVDKLLKSIKKPEKTVVIHIILTNIFEPEMSHNYFSIMSIYEGCYCIGYRNIYNGLIWSSIRDKEKIEESEIKKIRNYWKARIADKRTPWNVNIESIFRKYEIEDSLKQPCDKVYANDSRNLDLGKFQELFQKNAHEKQMGEIYTTLGNDSTISNYKDCFYVVYRMEDIQFRFNKDNSLSTIFIMKDFNGVLPFDIRLIDSKKTILDKLGSPNKIRASKYGTTYFYNSKGVIINFDENMSISRVLLRNPQE